MKKTARRASQASKASKTSKASKASKSSKASKASPTLPASPTSQALQSGTTIGIVSYGVALPRQRVTSEIIAQVQGRSDNPGFSLGIKSKSVPAADEDAATLATSAALQALRRLPNLEAGRAVKSLLIGSESHPYAVKPTGSIVAAALGLGPELSMSDLQFACKAGTQALQLVAAQAMAEKKDSTVTLRVAKHAKQQLARPGIAQQSIAQHAQQGEIQQSDLPLVKQSEHYLPWLGMAIGADTAQAKPGDILEFSASAAGVAIVVASREDDKSRDCLSTESCAESEDECLNPPILAEILATASVATDTPDFWRRTQAKYPEHAGRFTGEPAYFFHIKAAVTLVLEKYRNLTGVELQQNQIDRCVFHTPNGKFPRSIAAQLGFSANQIADSLVVDVVGNSYAAASPLALAAALDEAPAQQTILLASYGSGAGADAFLLRTTEALVTWRKNWRADDDSTTSSSVRDLINQQFFLEAHEYQRLRQSTH